MFRGKPAITKFDRLITPSRKSSQGFATPTGAALRRRAPSACSRLAHLASGLARPTQRVIYASQGLGSPAGSTCWPIMQKVHCRRSSSCCFRPGVSSPPWRAALFPSRYSTLPIPERVSLGGRKPPSSAAQQPTCKRATGRKLNGRGHRTTRNWPTFLPAAGSPTTTLCQLRSDRPGRNPG